MTGAIINNKLLKKITGNIENDGQINIHLPGIGRIHIDRKLPFLIVYRTNNDFRDYAVKRLIRSESSYCMFNVSADQDGHVRVLFESIIKSIAPEFGAFLICEIILDDFDPLHKSETSLKPRFRLEQPGKRSIENVTDILYYELGKYRINKQKPEFLNDQSPGSVVPGIESLISRKIMKSFNCYSMALTINPFFINPETTMPYPLVLRRFHRFFSRSFRRTIFEFTRSHCSMRPKNYQALGKRSFVKKIWEIDSAIYNINSMFDLLFLVTPYNVDQAWLKFRKSGFKKNPVFRYRPVPVDPSLLKRQLFKIDLNSIEDPVLFQLFYEKQLELDRQISLLLDRGTKRFLYGSMLLYGSVDESLYNIALSLLKQNPEPVNIDTNEPYLTAKEIQNKARKEVEKYRALNNELKSQVIVDKDVSGILVSNGDLYIGAKTKIRKSRIRAVLNHEVGTHIITYYNGLAQPFRLLQSGFAGYEELQEGIAVFSEYMSGGLTVNRVRILAARVIAAKHMIGGADFIETFRYLNNELNISKNLSYIITMRIYRSGGLTKDAIYLKGFIKLLKFLARTNDWKHIFYGKVSFEQLPLMHELESRKILKPIAVIPEYMGNYRKENICNADDDCTDLERLNFILGTLN